MRQWTREQLEAYVRREIQRTIDESLASALIYGPKLPPQPEPPVELTPGQCHEILRASHYALPIIQPMSVITADMMVAIVEPWPRELERLHDQSRWKARDLGLEIPGGDYHG